jgi:hypothetical protein
MVLSQNMPILLKAPGAAVNTSDKSWRFAKYWSSIAADGIDP